MKQGEKKIIIWDEHQPPKNYIWVHDGKAHEHDGKEWKETDINFAGFRLGESARRIIICDDNTTPPDNYIWRKGDRIFVNRGNDNWEDVTPVIIHSFGGLQIASGPLAYENNAYVIKEDWNHDSYDSRYGKDDGSTYFSFIDMGRLFEKEDFSAADGSIENLLDPFDGWRLPTRDEWAMLFSADRSGSTVNDVENAHYALISLTDVTHAGSSQINGALLFPDNEILAGVWISDIDGSSQTDMTLEELNVYLAQGCVFLPASGFVEDGEWSAGGQVGLFCSSTSWDDTTTYCLRIDDMDYRTDEVPISEHYCSTIRLIKPIE